MRWNPLARMVVLIGPSASLGMTEWGIGMTERAVAMTETAIGRMGNLLPMVIIDTLGMGNKLPIPRNCRQ